MHIRTVDLENDGECHAFYTAFREAELAGNADRPIWSEPEMRAFLAEPSDAEDIHVFGAFEDGENGQLVGSAFTFYPLLDNTEKAYTGVYVAPDRRGQGIGSALVDHVVEHAARLDRTALLAEATYGFDRREDHPYRRFAEKRGFVPASVEVARRAELPIPEAQLDAWIAEAEAHHTGYRVETFTDTVPADLLPSVCHVLNQLAIDAPTGDLDFEAEQVTPEIRRQTDARNKKSGLRRYETVAIDQTGAAVGVSTIGVPADSDKMHQWATIVLKAHRGHRLGLALKAHNLRAAQRDHPDRTAIHTQNHETNRPMVAINERFGFKPVELCVEFQRKLDA
jgi:GNAT superfamily N-acetyltransferase